MQTVKATDAKQKFGELIEMARSAPVTVTVRGRKTAVLLSQKAYERDQKIKQDYLDMRLKLSLAEARAGNLTASKDVLKKGLAVFDED